MTPPLDPALFAEDPARDARFTVVDRWSQMANFPPEDPRHHIEFLHRQMNEEVNGLEIAARNLVDFPDAPWELRLAVARQCWDESRHVEAFRACCERRGAHVGEYPVMNFQYRLAMRLPTLVGRLAVQNRSFEAAGLDAIQDGVGKAAALGEAEADVAALLDVQLADEMQHVRYANEWVPRLLQAGGPRATFEVVRAVAQAEAALREIAGSAEVRYPVATEVRREAGFSEAEIAAARASVERP